MEELRLPGLDGLIPFFAVDILVFDRAISEVFTVSAEGAGFVFAAVGLPCVEVRPVEGLKLGGGVQTRLQAFRTLLGVRRRREEAAGSRHGDGGAAVRTGEMIMKALPHE